MSDSREGPDSRKPLKIHRGADAFARLSLSLSGEHARGRPTAVQLLPLPLRIGAIGGFVLAALGLVWASVARVPEQVEGIAVIVPPHRIMVARAKMDGRLLYQVSGAGDSTLPAARQRLNRQIAAYWGDPDLIWAAAGDEVSLERLIRQLIRPPIGQDLNVTGQGGSGSPRVFVPGGDVIALIDSEQEREVLRKDLEHRLAELRIQRSQWRRRQGRLAELRLKEQLKTQQLLLVGKAIQRRQVLMKQFQKLEKLGGISSTRLLTEQEQLEALRDKALENRQDRLDGATRLGDEIDEVAASMDRRRQKLDALESTMISSLARTVHFSPPGGAYILRAIQINGAAVRNGDALFQYTPQPPVLPQEVPLLLGPTQAPRVFPGMEVSLTPYGMVRSQVGGIRGRVVRVGEVPVTAAKVMSVTGLDSASHPLLRRLPTAYLAIVRLETNPGAVCRGMVSRDCYRWTGNQTPQEPVRLGTLAEVHVTTRYRHPIEFVMPALRQLLGGSTGMAGR